MNSASCPEEHELLALLHGEPSSSEIQRHVEGCAPCLKNLARLRSEVATLRTFRGPDRVHAPAADGDPDAARPVFIGKYFIAGLIDEDDKSISYRAIHAVLHQEVVVTLARRALAADAAARPPWISAARRLIELEEPGLARVYDFDFFEDRPYVVSESVRGRSLAELAAERRLSPHEAATVLLPVAQGVAAAHRNGIVHGAILPPAIAITNDRRAKLTSLGGAWLERMAAEIDGSASDELAARRRDVAGLAAALIALGGPAQPEDPTAAQFVVALQRYVDAPRKRRQVAISAALGLGVLVVLIWAGRQLGMF